ncbi:MAG: type II toxin-antitoxin system HicB family antitoxin [Candidatus Hydrothermarchaeales archaeon]
MYKYVVIVEKADGNYSAYCPDLPSCVATAKTTTETIERMKEAIEFHLEGLTREGLSIPKPSKAAIEVAV